VNQPWAARCGDAIDGSLPNIPIDGLTRAMLAEHEQFETRSCG